MNRVCFLCVPPNPVSNPLNEILSRYIHIQNITVRRVFLLLSFPWPGPGVSFLCISRRNDCRQEPCMPWNYKSSTSPVNQRLRISIQCPTAGSVAPSGSVTSAAQSILRGKALWATVSVSVPDSPSHRSAFLPPHSHPLPPRHAIFQAEVDVMVQPSHVFVNIRPLVTLFVFTR